MVLRNSKTPPLFKPHWRIGTGLRDLCPPLMTSAQGGKYISQKRTKPSTGRPPLVKVSQVEDYPKGVDPDLVMLKERSIMQHPKWVRAHFGELLRLRRPLTFYELCTVRLLPGRSYRKAFRVFYSRSMHILVYCIPYFIAPKHYPCGQYPAQWTPSGFHGMIKGTYFWTDGAMIVRVKRNGHARMGKAPMVEIPLSDRHRALLFNKSVPAVDEKVEEILLIDHPEVYAPAAIVEVVTKNRVCYYDVRPCDFTNYLFYYSIPMVRVLDADNPQECFLVWRNRGALDNLKIRSVLSPLLLSDYSLWVIHQLKKSRAR